MVAFIMRPIFDRYERWLLAFGKSPWSTVALLAYGVAWLVWCAVEREVPGWDGVITIILGEIALATLRKVNV